MSPESKAMRKPRAEEFPQEKTDLDFGSRRRRRRRRRFNRLFGVPPPSKGTKTHSQGTRPAGSRGGALVSLVILLPPVLEASSPRRPPKLQPASKCTNASLNTNDAIYSFFSRALFATPRFFKKKSSTLFPLLSLGAFLRLAESGKGRGEVNNHAKKSSTICFGTFFFPGRFRFCREHHSFTGERRRKWLATKSRGSFHNQAKVLFYFLFFFFYSKSCIDF